MEHLTSYESGDDVDEILVKESESSNSPDGSDKIDVDRGFGQKLLKAQHGLRIPCPGSGAPVLSSLSRLISQIVPSHAAENERSSAWLAFEKLCRREFSKELAEENPIDGGIVLFGSWTYGMWIESSDIDVNFWTESCIQGFFKRLKSMVLTSYKGATITILANAKVPVAKIALPDNLLQIDVVHQYGKHNEVALHHVQVRDWARRWQDDEIISTSLRVIKHWAKARNIMNPYTGTLNSMGYFVMLLAIAEPATQSTKRNRPQDNDILAPILDLLRHFFSAYTELGAKRQVIYAPHGSVTAEGPELDILRLKSDIIDASTETGDTVFIQDPFLPTVNLGRFVNRRTAKKLREEFARASGLLREEGSSDALQRLVAAS